MVACCFFKAGLKDRRESIDYIFIRVMKSIGFLLKEVPTELVYSKTLVNCTSLHPFIHQHVETTNNLRDHLCVSSCCNPGLRGAPGYSLEQAHHLPIEMDSLVGERTSLF